jgi:hypothetical protein
MGVVSCSALAPQVWDAGLKWREGDNGGQSDPHGRRDGRQIKTPLWRIMLDCKRCWPTMRVALPSILIADAMFADGTDEG